VLLLCQPTNINMNNLFNIYYNTKFEKNQVKNKKNSAGSGGDHPVTQTGECLPSHIIPYRLYSGGSKHSHFYCSDKFFIPGYGWYTLQGCGIDATVGKHSPGADQNSHPLSGGGGGVCAPVSGPKYSSLDNIRNISTNSQHSVTLLHKFFTQIDENSFILPAKSSCARFHTFHCENNHYFHIPYYCKKRTCKFCSKVRIATYRKKFQPILCDFKYPLFVTLTLKYEKTYKLEPLLLFLNDEDVNSLFLMRELEEIQMKHPEVFEKLLFVRNTKKKDIIGVELFHKMRKDIVYEVRRIVRCFERLRRSKFWKNIEKKQGYKIKGVYTIEVQLKKDLEKMTAGWYVHIHCIMDCEWMSQEELSDKWLSITNDSKIVDVRRVRGKFRAVEYKGKVLTLQKSIYELFKYQTKMWELTKFEKDVVDRGLKNVRFINVFGFSREERKRILMFGQLSYYKGEGYKFMRSILKDRICPLCGCTLIRSSVVCFRDAFAIFGSVCRAPPD